MVRKIPIYTDPTKEKKGINKKNYRNNVCSTNVEEIEMEVGRTRQDGDSKMGSCHHHVGSKNRKEECGKNEDKMVQQNIVCNRVQWTRLAQDRLWFFKEQQYVSDKRG